MGGQCGDPRRVELVLGRAGPRAEDLAQILLGQVAQPSGGAGLALGLGPRDVQLDRDAMLDLSMTSTIYLLRALLRASCAIFLHLSVA